MGIIYGLLSSLFQAFGHVGLKKSYQELSPSVAFMFEAFFGLVIWLPLSLVWGVQFDRLLVVFAYALISAVLSEAFVFYVLSKGEISITGTIFATYPVYTILFSLFINHERLMVVSAFFICLTILGIIIVTLPQRINKKKFIRKSFIIWPLLGAIAVGLSDSLSKNIIDRTSAATFLFALSFCQIPVGLIYLKVSKQPLAQFKTVFNNFKKYQYAILGSFSGVVCVLFLWLAFQSTLASVASPLTATYPGITIVLAYFFLKEKISPKDFLGLIVIILGIIGLSFIV